MAFDDRRRENVGERISSSYSNQRPSQIRRNTRSLSYPNNGLENDFRRKPRRQNSKKVWSTRILPVEQERATNQNTNLHEDQRDMPPDEVNTNTTTSKQERPRRPWFIWIISIVQICFFIAEMISNGVLTGSPIERNLSINPLFGPSPFVLINMGASFSPCMHPIDGITNNVSSTNFPCPNSTTLTSKGCTLSALCGFNGVSDTPNQWYRFIISLFLHVGIVHILLNLLAQILIGRKIERKIGTLRTILIYFPSGIFGFIFGGNFGAEGLTRVGCSGSLFSIIALSLLDLLYHWKKIKHPKRRLIIYLVDIIINFVLGLLPGIDNFSHVGGFCMGLLLGLAILGSPINFRRRKKEKTFTELVNEWNTPQWHSKFFHNRPKSWWIWWFVRFIAFALVITVFVLLTENFYSQRIKCTWCKYLSCLPVNGWCDIGLLTKNNT